jgi:hypothetical protein
MIRAHGAKVLKDYIPNKEDLNAKGLRSFDLPFHINEVVAAKDNRKSIFQKFKFNNPIRSSMISKPVATDPEQFKEWEGRSEPIAMPPRTHHPAYTASVYSRDSRMP